MGHYDDEPRRPWGQTWRDQWPHNIRGRSADVVILDDYAENLGDALNAHMADSYKQSALDKLFGVIK
jgi:hypothetical protein